MGLEQQADAQHAILLPALHDVAGLDEDFLVALIGNGELIDLADLTHLDGLLGQCLGQGQRHRPAAGFAMHEIDREIAVHLGTGQPVAVGRLGIGGVGDERQAERNGGRHGGSPQIPYGHQRLLIAAAPLPSLTRVRGTDGRARPDAAGRQTR